jgi:serine/threonine protein kinase
MKPLAQNTLLQNRYLIVQLIGKGGMGEVYLAIDQRLGSPVALKRTFYAEDDQLGNAFEREARTLARLRHPVLPKVSDHFIENGNQFLAMEHISGDDLAKRLKATQKPFPLSWVLFWADQLLEGLVYLHSHEPPIIHRDIKPQNLKLTDENNVILLDFGLSKNTLGQVSESGVTTDSVVGYTPNYAPLEQIRGTGTNPRSDIFALSATLYQLLTNVVPPDALSRADDLLGGFNDPIKPISEIKGEVPPAVSDIILKGMSIRQEQRFQNAREMQKELRESFSRMQKAMAAQTVPVISQSDKTAENAAVSTFEEKPAPNIEIGAQTIPFGFTGDTFGESASDNSKKKEEVVDFDATLRYDSQGEGFPPLPNSSAPADTSPKQAEIRTEVFLSPDLNELGLSENAKNQLTEEQLKPVTTDENVALGATMPGFNVKNLESKEKMPDFNETEAEAEAQRVSFSEDFSESLAATQFASQEFRSQNLENQQSEQQFVSTPVAAEAEQGHPVKKKQKSKGFLFGILGGFLALLLVGGGAIALGYYYYIGGFGVINSPTPTPAPTVEITPTPVSTPEQNVANTDVNNTNSDVSNANTELIETDSPTPTPEIKTETTRTAQTPATTQPTTKPPTPRPTQIIKPPPTIKPTVKPTTKPTLRGTRDIPQ